MKTPVVSSAVLFVLFAASLLLRPDIASAQALGVREIARVGNGPLPPNSLTGIAQPPGNSRDLFLAMQQGLLLRVHDGALVVAPVLDLGGSIPHVPHYGDESGLLGIAFHPQFSTNGFLYVCYSGFSPGSGTELPGVHVVRYSLDPSDPSSTLPYSARHVLYYSRDPGPSTGHFGGWIGFGPDGFLYLSTGDALQETSQSLVNDLGKILRIDVDHDDFPSDPVANYAIPPTNPYFGSTSALPEIWALGLRNPWRCSFDRVAGDLWIADVGESTREEVDFQPAASIPPFVGRNYGWPCMEGVSCHGGTGCICNDPNYTPPLYDYPHITGGYIIGGSVYRGSSIPALQGCYMFADSGHLWTFRRSSSGITDLTDRTTDLGDVGRTTFGEDSSGELYFGARSGSDFVIYKIVPACPANCDHSAIEPRLNVNDFVCFLNKFAAGDTYANCDASTTPPVLNILDFTCFLDSFAAGCP